MSMLAKPDTGTSMKPTQIVNKFWQLCETYSDGKTTATNQYSYEIKAIFKSLATRKLPKVKIEFMKCDSRTFFPRKKSGNLHVFVGTLDRIIH